jgi:hypothetical protein
MLEEFISDNRSEATGAPSEATGAKRLERSDWSEATGAKRLERITESINLILVFFLIETLKNSEKL